MQSPRPALSAMVVAALLAPLPGITASPVFNWTHDLSSHADSDMAQLFQAIDNFVEQDLDHWGLELSHPTPFSEPNAWYSFLDEQYKEHTNQYLGPGPVLDSQNAAYIEPPTQLLQHDHKNNDNTEDKKRRMPVTPASGSKKAKLSSDRKSAPSVDVKQESPSVDSAATRARARRTRIRGSRDAVPAKSTETRNQDNNTNQDPLKSLVEREMEMIQDMSYLPQGKRAYFRRMQRLTNFSDYEIAVATAGICYKSHFERTITAGRFDVHLSDRDIATLSVRLERTVPEILSFFQTYFNDFRMEFKTNYKYVIRHHPACLTEFVVPKGAFAVTGGIRRMEDIFRTDPEFHRQLQAKLQVKVNVKNQGMTTSRSQSDIRETASLADQEFQRLQDPHNLSSEKQESLAQIREQIPQLSEENLAALVSALCYKSSYRAARKLFFIRISNQDLTSLSKKLKLSLDTISQFFYTYMTRSLGKDDLKLNRQYWVPKHPICDGIKIIPFGGYSSRGFKRKIVDVLRTDAEFHDMLEKAFMEEDGDFKDEGEEDMDDNGYDGTDQAQGDLRPAQTEPDECEDLETCDFGVTPSQSPQSEDASADHDDQSGLSLYDQQLLKIQNPDLVPLQKRQYVLFARNSFPDITDEQLAILTAAMCYYTNVREKTIVDLRLTSTTINALSKELEWDTHQVTLFYKRYLKRYKQKYQSDENGVVATMHDHPACLDEYVRDVGNAQNRWRKFKYLFEINPPQTAGLLLADVYKQEMESNEDDGDNVYDS